MSKKQSGLRRATSKGENKKPERMRAARRQMAGLPKTATQYNAKPERFRQAYERTIKVLSKMRTEKVTLTQAARDVGVSRDTVIRWARSALKKGASGRYTAKASDNLLRMLQIPTKDGLREIGVRGSRQASTLGEYWAAVQKYLRTGDSSVLAKFRDQEIKDATGTLVPLVTDVRVLKDLARAGVLTFESLYRRGV